MTPKRKKMLLALLIILFIATLAYRLVHPFEQARVAKLTYTPEHTKPAKMPAGDKRSTRNTTPRNAENSGPELLAALFRNPPHHSGLSTRNLFNYTKGNKEVPGSTTANQQPVEEKAAEPSPAASASEPEPTPYERIHQALGEFKIFGFMKKNNVIILFVERGKDLFMLKAGDLIDSKFEVQQITDNTLSIKAKDIGETVRIDLRQLTQDVSGE